MKKGKEIKLKLKENYNVKLGTVNNKDPKSIYLNITAWGDPINYDESNNYVSIINRLKKHIKSKLYENLNKDRYYPNNYIVDLDMRHSGIKNNKRSFMSCEITLYQKDKLPVTDDKLQGETKKIINEIIENCLESNTDFKFYRTKK